MTDVKDLERKVNELSEGVAERLMTLILLCRILQVQWTKWQEE